MFSLPILSLFAVFGALAGLLAGLLGIGGGVLLVPLFLFIFPLVGIPPELVPHCAVGTSLAVIIPTAASSTLAHRKHGNVEWHQVAWLGIGGAGGALIGSTLAVFLPGLYLKGLFGLMQIAVAARMLAAGSSVPLQHVDQVAPLPLVAVGLVGGAFSAFFGVGGGVVAVPLMLFILKLPMHRAVGNSSALIVLSASVGAMSYAVHGWGMPNLPSGSFGYVMQPVALTIAPFTILFAHLGVKLANRIARDKLVHIFALLLILVGLKILYPLVISWF